MMAPKHVEPGYLREQAVGQSIATSGGPLLQMVDKA